MKTLLKSQELWDIVEGGYKATDDENKSRENKKKDSKALVIIQQAVHDSVFSRIVAAGTSKEAWSILQKEFQGDSKVKVSQANQVKLISRLKKVKDEVFFVGAFVVVFVDVDVEAIMEEESMLETGNPMSTKITRMAFSVIIARDMVI
ncbi:hypothetical protein DCAR_0102211 [Daucus carota subsp. sativus]|uniref:DUF4219 domain-containing protein n=1 Tax=Daucus carota subsp. sativus TaxID=79200 RepID=A0AAF0W4T8_DAUCS|nr:hypothetical protein DCAR_0102211 [Daucus carota subsp. sativus]